MSQLSYSAVMYMEEPQHCGQAGQVMKPEFTAYRISPHARVLCVECRVTPGATGWLESKVAGTRQLLSVILNNYPRPIQSAIFSGDGKVARGKKVFEEKRCATCHNDPASGAPQLTKGKHAYSAVVMVSVLWDTVRKCWTGCGKRRYPGRDLSGATCTI